MKSVRTPDTQTNVSILMITDEETHVRVYISSIQRQLFIFELEKMFETMKFDEDCRY